MKIRNCINCEEPFKSKSMSNLCPKCIREGKYFLPTGDEYEKLKAEVKEAHLLKRQRCTGKMSPPIGAIKEFTSFYNGNRKVWK